MKVTELLLNKGLSLSSGDRVKLVKTTLGLNVIEKDVELVSVFSANVVNKMVGGGFVESSLRDLDSLFEVNQAELLCYKFTDEVCQMLSRYDAEHDPRFKQLITYVVLKSPKYTLGYKRLEGGGEGRLHGKVSIGVGGHVNELVQDIYKISGDVTENALRELKEELHGLPSGISADDLDFVGFINSNEDSVGKVHLGLVYTYNTTDELIESLISGEDDTLSLVKLEVVDGFTVGLDEGFSFENWTELLLPYVEKLGD